MKGLRISIGKAQRRDGSIGWGYNITQMGRGVLHWAAGFASEREARRAARKVMKRLETDVTGA